MRADCTYKYVNINIVNKNYDIQTYITMNFINKIKRCELLYYNRKKRRLMFHVTGIF